MIKHKPSAAHTRNRISPSLGTLDGKRVAIVIGRNGSQIVLRGCARSVKIRQESLLQIKVDQSESQGSPVFQLKENEWRGSIVTDRKFGCDYQVRLEMLN